MAQPACLREPMILRRETLALGNEHTGCGQLEGTQIDPSKAASIDPEL
jgi:hypothetical protein